MVEPGEQERVEVVLAESEVKSAPGMAFVVIGRNEGERLKRCLRSVAQQVEQVVYVDSGSGDGSVEFARSMGVDVVELDMSQPFTMARGRNAGWRRVAEHFPDIDLVHFVDGDCEVVPGWIELARETLQAHPEVAVVCGRRRERHPEASLYNALTDMEWDGPTGDVAACGGDALMRLDVLQALAGFNEGMIAGEEPELSVRIRQLGSRILRLDAEMTLHDAAMTRLGQWWQRAVRCGHAYAEGAALQGRTPERHCVRPLARALLYGAALPALALAALVGLLIGASGAGWILAGVFGVYVMLVWKVFRGRLRHGDAPRRAAAYSAFIVLGKLAHARGALKYALNRLRGRHTGLLEYKQPSS